MTADINPESPRPAEPPPPTHQEDQRGGSIAPQNELPPFQDVEEPGTPVEGKGRPRIPEVPEHTDAGAIAEGPKDLNTISLELSQASFALKESLLEAGLLKPGETPILDEKGVKVRSSVEGGQERRIATFEEFPRGRDVLELERAYYAEHTRTEKTRDRERNERRALKEREGRAEKLSLSRHEDAHIRREKGIDAVQHEAGADESAGTGIGKHVPKKGIRAMLRTFLGL